MTNMEVDMTRHRGQDARLIGERKVVLPFLTLAEWDNGTLLERAAWLKTGRTVNFLDGMTLAARNGLPGLPIGEQRSR